LHDQGSLCLRLTIHSNVIFRYRNENAPKEESLVLALVTCSSSRPWVAIAASVLSTRKYLINTRTMEWAVDRVHNFAAGILRVVGALIAAAITLGTSSPYLLSVLLFAFSVLMFAGRGVNTVLFQMSLVPFMIILLNIIYPGEWYFAFDRILDVAIGGAIAIGVVYVFDAVKNLGR
jgi:uncharacterized membrane protein YccC